MRPRGIVVHHSATGPLTAAAALRRFRKEHVEQGVWTLGRDGRRRRIRLRDVAYHKIIGSDGRVVQGRPDNVRGAHTRGFNDTLGICLVGNFDLSPPPDRQLRTLVDVCARLCLRYDWPVTAITYHCNHCPTACPGRLFRPLYLLRSVVGLAKDYYRELGEFLSGA